MEAYPKKVEGKKEAMKLRGIGKSIGEKVEEWCQTGKLKLLEDLCNPEYVQEKKEQAKKEEKEKEEGMAFAFMD